MSAITWTSTPTMATIKLPSGNVYYLKDAEVRAWIGTGSSSGAEYRITTLESAVAALSNATHWLGITTTALTDGSTTNPVTIGGESVTAVSGDIVQYSDKEFIFNGTSWQEFGASLGTLKAFAYVDQGITKSFTPAGTNSTSAVSFSGGTDDTFVKSYPGTTSKMVTTTITPVSSMPSFAMDSTDTEMLVITNGAAGSPVTVATGSLDDSASGASIMTGLGTAVTASAVTSIGSGTAAAQTFTGTAMTVDVDPKSTT